MLCMNGVERNGTYDPFAQSGEKRDEPELLEMQKRFAKAVCGGARRKRQPGQHDQVRKVLGPVSAGDGIESGHARGGKRPRIGITQPPQACGEGMVAPDAVVTRLRRACRHRTSAPEPETVNGKLPLLLPFRVAWVRVQDHLRLIQHAKPERPFISGR